MNQLIGVLKEEELCIQDLPAQVQVGDARSWAIAASLPCVVSNVRNADSAATMLNLCCLGNSAQCALLPEHVIAEAIRSTGCLEQKLRSVLLYLSLTVEEMEERLQAGGSEWLGTRGGLHGMGEKTTAVINTYYKGIFDFVVDTNVHRVFGGRRNGAHPARQGRCSLSGTRRADQCQWGSEQATCRANTAAARRWRFT